MNLKNYEKKKEFLICVDSDGCAMDTMDIKHIRCFGPCMVEEWGLGKWKEPILERWNEINLYTMTRGINRFKGLAKMLGEVHETYMEIEDLPALEKWVEESSELSNQALADAIREKESVALKKALFWSVKVNEKINDLPFDVKKPFSGVKEALAAAHEKADIAIVSSANLQAVEEEWELYGLLKHVDILLAQDTGSKAFCIGELVKKGYNVRNVLMTGDAPGDYEAASKNGVFFYPILVRHENESWEEFRNEGALRLFDGSYEGAYQEKKIAEFMDNLK
ncbi:HAD family hydrolase [Clostridium sp. AF19-22AC]|jgi:phosphoglycolate phosphatase-like HAD superfamily hydrolase|uniref:HAD family hydrolase n=1 Tax=Clostridia TaxID=186801 RepID=UPI000E511EB0|nr:MULTISPECIES: HAD hydrolase-like protein [Clostridia]RHR30729.1 HAD family hydrolase [Clostridium sp. AF19-22AC]